MKKKLIIIFLILIVGCAISISNTTKFEFDNKKHIKIDTVIYHNSCDTLLVPPVDSIK